MLKYNIAGIPGKTLYFISSDRRRALCVAITYQIIWHLQGFLHKNADIDLLRYVFYIP